MMDAVEIPARQQLQTKFVRAARWIFGVYISLASYISLREEKLINHSLFLYISLLFTGVTCFGTTRTYLCDSTEK